jgi:hypothetical protein
MENFPINYEELNAIVPPTKKKSRYINLENNIYPKDATKIFFTINDRTIIKSIKPFAFDTCRGKISEAYISKSFNRFKNGFLYKDEDDEIIGYCLWKEVNDTITKSTIPLKYLHILLVCAIDTDGLGLGRKILFDVEEYCIEKKIPSIRLEPANEKLEKYYESIGYIRVVNIPPFTMAKNINTVSLIINNKKSITRKKKKI